MQLNRQPRSIFENDLRKIAATAFAELDESDQKGFEDTVGMLIRDYFRQQKTEHGAYAHTLDEIDRHTAEWTDTAVSWHFS